jgi:chromate transporter
VELLDLFVIFLKASLLSWGGSQPLPILQDELIRQRGLLSDQDFATAIAIGRITPGPNGLFVLPIGYFVAGFAGALAAVLALCAVALSSLVLLRLHAWLAQIAAVAAGIRGIQAGAIGLTFAVGYLILQATVRSPLDFVVAAAAFALLAFTRVDAMVVLGGAGALGLLVLLRAG